MEEIAVPEYSKNDVLKKGFYINPYVALALSSSPSFFYNYAMDPRVTPVG